MIVDGRALHFGFDTEDNSLEVARHGGKRRLLFGFVGDDEYLHRFTDFKSFVSIVLRLSKSRFKNVFWAVNCLYDLINLCENDFTRFNFTMVGSRFIRATLRGYPKIQFYDTLNHAKASAAKIGELVGIEKLPFDLSSDEYAKQDVRIVVEFVKKRVELYNSFGARAKSTIGATSMDVLLKSFNLRQHLWRFNPPELSAFRNSYFGGRVGFANTGIFEGTVNWYDINSLYPSTMLEDFPVLKTIKAGAEIDTHGVTHLKIKLPRTRYGVLPVKTETGNFYPTNTTIEGFYNNIEIRKALEYGAKITKIFYGYHFTDSKKIFTDFVDCFHELKNKSVGIERQTWKDILNNPSGKFAEGSSAISELTADIPDDYEGILFQSGNRFVAPVEMERETLPLHANVIFSSCITARGRCRLNDSIQENEKSVLYWDTDSAALFNTTMSTGKNLGEWQLEKTGNKLAILGKKLYILYSDGVRVKKGHKGFKAKTSYKEKLLFESRVSVWRAPVKLMSGLRRKINPNSWIFFHKQPKQQRKPTMKQFNAEGWKQTQHPFFQPVEGATYQIETVCCKRFAREHACLLCNVRDIKNAASEPVPMLIRGMSYLTPVLVGHEPGSEFLVTYKGKDADKRDAHIFDVKVDSEAVACGELEPQFWGDFKLEQILEQVK